MGIDSLVAVEARSWFLKELKVDIPVLKLVGGASIAEVCQVALEKLPEELTGKLEVQGEPVNANISEPETNDSPTKPESESESTTQPVSTPPSTPAASDVDSVEPSPEVPFSKPLLDVPRSDQKVVKNVPISLSQSRFWFLRLLLEDQQTYNVTFYYHITGNLRIADLERAVQTVTNRHEALRTRFVEDPEDASRAYQEVLSNSNIVLETKKINSFDEVATEYAKLKQHSFDLGSGVLLKLVLLTLSPSSSYLLINHHHIIIDGVSFQVLIADLEKAYNGQSLGPLPRQYPDISEAQHRDLASGKMINELHYWQNVFPPGEQLPVLPLLPMARTSSRSAMKKFDTHQVACHVNPEVASRIKKVSRANQSTPFHFYLAAFKSLLFSFCDADDLTIGVADAARHDMDVLDSIGFFLNLLPLRFHRKPSQSFSEALVDARKTTYAALSNSKLPFDVMLAEMNVSRSSTHSPFFQAFLDYRQGAQEKHTWGNCEFEVQEAHPGRTAYDITLDVTDSPNNALVMIRVQKSLYDLTAADLLLQTFVHFLDVLSADSTLPLDKTPLFSPEQRLQAVTNGHGKPKRNHSNIIDTVI